IHGFHFINALAVNSPCLILVYGSVSSQRQHHSGSGIDFPDPSQDPVRLFLPGDLITLDLIYKKQADLTQITAVQSAVIGRGIQYDHHPLLISPVNDIIQFIDLILKKDHISLFKRIQNLIHELSGYAAVGSPVKKDAVLAVPVHLDDGMAAGPVDLSDKIHIDAVLSAGVNKDSAFVSDHSGM